jgi:NADH-quinone oxidoreductase subunit C
MSTDPGPALAAALALPGGAVTRSAGGAFERSTVDVPAEAWVRALTEARDGLGCDFFDWLGAVDLGGTGFQVVAHVWSTTQRYGLLVRTQLLPDAPELMGARQALAPAVPSLVSVYPGAAWHEREAYEMFGIDFPGHPGLANLLLAPEFEGHPLRKDFVLASRVVKPWPGAVEPGESAATAAAASAEPGRRGRRQPQRPPGVPAPGEWGPR